MHYVGTRLRPSERSPFRRHAAVFGYTAEQKAEIVARRDRQYAADAVGYAERAVLDARRAYCEDRRAIGDANRGISRGLHYPNANAWQRRSFRSIAFSRFNRSLRELRAAEKALAEAQVRLAALAGA